MGQWRVFLGCLAAMMSMSAGGDWAVDDLDGLEWREIGPYRGGRSAAVVGIPDDRETFYFGATGGGVWKTTDGGNRWKNVSDGFFGGSVGAVAVSAWDPNVLYVGMGEKTVRGNVSHGDGIWKSTDAGSSWEFTGLDDSRHISRIRIHPKRPELVYAAVMGHLFGPSDERGVYRSSNGGESWERVLFVNAHAGAVDLVMDPENPRILYASTWRILRTPYSLESGGEGSGLWKSMDGGDTWISLAEMKGMPEAPWGISGITVSPSNNQNVYAIIEAEQGGVFRSRDGGESWKKVNSERKLRQRAWYYSRINADPKDEDSVYVSNVRFHYSTDGGKSFEAIPTPHGDNHDLWIDPQDPLRMIQANDGGANVSYDGGENWTSQANQPTAQMYRISVDNAFPYRLLGGQQDNSAVRIRSRSAYGSAIGERDWEPTAGGESGHIVAHPEQPDVVYGGSYGGYLVRFDHRNGDRRIINVWPDNPLGWGAAELKYRFNWNFPLMFSPHDSGTLYAAANVLFRTKNEGQTWEAISPDLTRNLKEKQGPSGGPITKDNTSVEYYGTIFAIAESPLAAGTLWTGSDDGLVHVSRDGGSTWDEVTPAGFPEEIQVNAIEAHPFEVGGAYLAATAYKSDDFRPQLYRTSNFGRSWKKIVDGIAKDHFTRVIRADPVRPGLLYAGTERGVYQSHDDGANWRPVQLNLPVVPITDMAIKDGNLAVATQGRGFWIFDDLSVLRQLEDDSLGDAMRLFEPAPAWRLANGRAEDPGTRGTNSPSGVSLHFWLPELPAAEEAMALIIKDSAGQVIRTFTRKPSESEPQDQASMGDDDRVLEARAGLNTWVWDLQYPSAEKFAGMVLWNRNLEGPRAIPGEYSATLRVGDQEQQVSFSVLADPRLDADADALEAQFAFILGINHKLTEAHRAVTQINKARGAIDGVLTRAGEQPAYADLVSAGEQLVVQLSEVEESLYNTRMEARQDPLNFPIRLTDKLAGVMGSAAVGDHGPTDSMIGVRDELIGAIDAELAKLALLLEDDLASFNSRVADSALPAVILEP